MLRASSPASAAGQHVLARHFPGDTASPLMRGLQHLLVHRIRAEALHHGTTAGVHRALATTSGVISAAGLILAATFGALTVMPQLYLAQIGCIVAVGVLIDALVVRLFLVPALILDLGHRTWWPTRLPKDLSLPRIGPPPHAGDSELPAASTPAL